tara:strand:+ start:14193 stop:14831 length:639 start_codon:yes stop_codon:yes gene_type:complete
MDELDLLKKDWKKQGDSFQKLSYDDIYKMIHKKSSSIVRWIFIICIGELIFWGLLNLAIPEKYLEIYEKFNLRTFINATQVLHYIVIFVFVYLFYKNHKAISVIDSTSLLMKKIINTRKTVNYYVYYNIIVYIILSFILNIIMFSKPEILIEVFNPDQIKIDSDKLYNIILIVQIVVFFIMCGFLWLYYRIIYGILLKRLNKNYKELESLDL